MSFVSGPTIDGKPRLQRLDHGARVVDAERRLGDEGELVRVGDLQAGHLLGARDQMHPPGDAAHRAFDLGMAGMADQDDLAPLIGIALALDMDLRDQRAGRVDDRQPALAGAPLDLARHAVRAEDRHRARRHLVDLVDKAGALGAQPLDDMPVVHDLVPDIDRRAVFLERALDDLDRPFDPGTKPAGLRQHHSHSCLTVSVPGPPETAARRKVCCVSLP